MQAPVHPYRSIRGFFTLLGQLVLILFLGFLAIEAWHGYQSEKLTALFNKDAHPVPVVVDNISNEKKIWKDYIGNSKYIHFTYNNKPYSCRYVQDSVWVGPGSKVVLMYHEVRDEFRQGGLMTRKLLMYKTSKLVDFTMAGLLSNAHIWLFGFALLSIVLVFFISGMLANLTGSDTISRFINILAGIVFLAGALYISIDAYKYYSYARQVRTNATATRVTLLDKYKEQLGNSHRSDNIEIFYFYTALVHYNSEDRIIPISEKEYDGVPKGAGLSVLYNNQMDEMTSANFSPSYSNIVFAAIVWILLIFWIVQRFKRKTTFSG